MSRQLCHRAAETRRRIKYPRRRKKTADSQRLAARDGDWDEAKHPRKANGQFGTGGAKKDLQKGSKSANVVAPAAIKGKFRSQLKGTQIRGDGKVQTVTDHACDRMYERNIYAGSVRAALANGTRTKSQKHPGTFEHLYKSWKIVVDGKGNIVTAIYKGKEGAGK